MLNNSYNDNISMEELKTVISKMNIRKASGPDEIAPFMIINANHILLECILKIFNKSFDLGVIPQKWLISKIIPIPKVKKTL